MTVQDMERSEGISVELSLSDRHAIAERGFPLLLFVDSELRIVAKSANCDGVLDYGSDVLGADLMAAIRRLGIIATMKAGGCRRAFMPPNFVMTFIPLDGAPLMIAIGIERFRSRANLSPAIKSFSLTPREAQILQHILEGRTASQIAQYLCLAETTVQSYFKRLLEKTQARNRASMAAKVLGWRT